MKRFLALWFVLCAAVLLLLASPVFAQGNSANGILEKMKQNTLKIQDYQADIRIKTNVEFLKIPESTSILYYKQPDKIKLKSDHFSLVPKKFQFFSPLVLLKNEYTSYIEREEKLGNNNCYVIKIIPAGEKGDIILTTAWVDKSVLVFRKLDVITKIGGSMVLNMEYDPSLIKKYPLPSSIVFSFDVGNMSISRNMDGNSDEDDMHKKNKQKLTKGSVEMQFTNYKVNIGLDDKLFDDKKKK